MRSTDSVKRQAISLIKGLPEDISLDEIMYHLYVKGLIKAKEDIAKRNVYSMKK